ncbi:hypothetical protein SMACR_04912 [Sordaria macrospora]|uniref:WGS project CABT00000000 data, contig 2.1 n=2 Tax=Sordaria macrospora TaxID=5147 RepID=F7VLZ1_SORMK|nr:uncharacterized protein SMAC_04912 [Sordaria macrospora k-hell]KAA8630894.1 hypothetical protein SMACR_04912 [Sordaria macrospora]WPJ59487.1 hypothetical protein SMAC4_04912 [Sordaria macrospora]CCC06519.1 unnamed protein product [Sordaria macrospora k-hell]
MGSHQVSGDKPILLFTSLPATGHITPTLRIASSLHARGWPVFYLGPTAHKATISATGVKFLPFLDDADFNNLAYFASQSGDDAGEGEAPLPSPPVSEPEATTTDKAAPEPTWRDRILFIAREMIISPIPSQHRSLLAALVHMHRLYSSHPSTSHPSIPSQRRVIVIAESMFNGLLPLFHSAPLPPFIPKPIAFLALSVMIPPLRSVDLPPLITEPVEFSTTSSSSSSSETHRKRVAEMWRDWEVDTKDLKDFMVEKVEREAGGKDFAKAMDAHERKKGRESGWAWLSGENFVGYNHVFQVGVESWFYKTEEGWPGNWSFVGVVPKLVPVLEEEAKQALVEEVKRAREKEGKKVVVVTQGTVEIDPRQLIIPTLQALSARQEDILVVAILGHRGRKLHKDVLVPGNVKVTDYLPYDAILPYADVFVNNAGYGAVMHGIGHGVPMVVAGEEQDKKENATRVQWRRHGIKLSRSWTEGKEYVKELGEAVEKVFDDKEGKEVRKRARELKDEADGIDCVKTVEDCLLSYL